MHQGPVAVDRHLRGQGLGEALLARHVARPDGRHGLRRALEGLVCQHLSIARVAEGLGVSWNTASTAVLVEGRPKQAFKAWLPDRDQA